MHEAPVSQVDAHMRVLLSFLVEEHQIAAAQGAGAHERGLPAQRACLARYRHPGLAEAVVDQAAAIEPLGRAAAIAVGLAQHGQGHVRGAIGLLVGGLCDGTRARRRRRTILFVDEIHRFNRGQQDAFLPHVEKGTIVLVGATTENPSFEVNSALLSRCRVYVLHALTEDDLVTIMQRALADGERGLAGLAPEVADEALRLIARLGNGDARSALNILELAVQLAPQGIRANAICPGATDTPALRRDIADGTVTASVEDIAGHIPMRRLGTVDDVASVALFLASDASAYVTGQAIPVDGGATA